MRDSVRAAGDGHGLCLVSVRAATLDPGLANGLQKNRELVKFVVPLTKC
jgi:hypothetical protein